MIRVAALTGGRNTPSTRFRIRQHIPSLQSQGIQVTEYCPFISQHVTLPGFLGRIRLRYLPPVAAAQVTGNLMARIPGILGSRKSDITWIERNFLPGFESLVKTTKRPRVLDVDDAIWMSHLLGRQSLLRLLKNVDTLIAGNRFLADWFSKYCRKVYEVPTAIDCSRFRPKNSRESVAEDESFVIGWTGTFVNFRYLVHIENALAKFLCDHSKASLLIIADRRPRFRLIPQERVSFMPWDPVTETEGLHQMDVGIMPLTEDDWSRGKCSFKMLQYMASALPVVVSPVGLNQDILAQGECGLAPQNGGEWYDALSALHRDPALRSSLGNKGRRLAEMKYDLPIISSQLTALFKEIIP